MSNGALLCYRLANQLAHRFAAIAPVAGDLVSYPWNPVKPIPIISFHSYLDQNVKYYGGVTIGTTGTYFPPQDSMFNIISNNYACSILKDTLFHNTSQYDHFKLSNCSCNSVIEQYVSYDGEHSWPGGLASGTTTTSNKFSATYLMWQFFQNYTINCLTTENIESANKEILKVYPNPFFNTIKISDTNSSQNFFLYNSMGLLIWYGKNINQEDFSHLRRGFYFLKINNRSLKLIKE